MKRLYVKQKFLGGTKPPKSFDINTACRSRTVSVVHGRHIENNTNSVSKTKHNGRPGIYRFFSSKLNFIIREDKQH